MNGPEHYREAERLLSFVVDSEGDVDSDSELSANTLASAQVHATLALAAVTAMGTTKRGSIQHMAWVRAFHGMDESGASESEATR